LKYEYEIPVIYFIPPEVVLKCALQETKDLPIHVILGSAEKE